MLKNRRYDGFSLLEVSVALLIFSISIVTIYQLIASAQVSSQSMKEMVIAREIANNRIAALETVDYPIAPGTRVGSIKMAGQEWLWTEETISTSKYLNKFSISVSLRESGQVIFIREGYFEKR